MDRGTVVVPGSRLSVLEEHDGRVARLVFDHAPDNALDVTLVDELLVAVDALERWPELSCVVLEGKRDFGTGFALSHRRMPYLDLLLTSYLAACRKLVSLEAVRIALVRGRCFGAGFELALLCHTILADATARFAFPDLSLGAFAPVGSLLLPDRIGVTKAEDWLLSGRTVPGDEALAAGLLTGFAAGWDNLDTMGARHVEQQVLARPTGAVRALARALSLDRRERLERDLPETERLFRERVAGARDHDEGVSAALRGRPPRWTGR